DLVPDGRLVVEPLREARDHFPDAQSPHEPGIEGPHHDATLRSLARDGDGAAGGGETADLHGEVQGAIRIVPHVRDIDESTAARVKNARGLVGEDALGPARGHGQGALVVLVRAEPIDVEHVLDLVARQGYGADLHPDVVAEDAAWTQASRLRHVRDLLAVEPGEEGGLRLLVTDLLLPFLFTAAERGHGEHENDRRHGPPHELAAPSPVHERRSHRFHSYLPTDSFIQCAFPGYTEM